jgi:hypothetical protein
MVDSAIIVGLELLEKKHKGQDQGQTTDGHGGMVSVISTCRKGNVQHENWGVR